MMEEMTLREAFNWLMYGKEPEPKAEADQSARHSAEREKDKKASERESWTVKDYLNANEMPPLPLRQPFPEEIFPEPTLKVDTMIPASAANLVMDVRIPHEKLTACVLVGDGPALTVHVNRTTAPDMTITLQNGALLFWCKLWPAEELFKEDVQRLFISNRYDRPGRFRMALHY